MTDRAPGINFMDAFFTAISFFSVYSAAMLVWGEFHKPGPEELAESRANGRHDLVDEPVVSIHKWRP